MTKSQYIISFLELAGGALVIWAVFNEYKFIIFENKLKKKIKNFLEVIL